MRHGKDDRTLDIFEVPVPMETVPGAGNYADQVSALVSEILKSSGMERCDIAARMSDLSGDDISKHMLDAWSSPARAAHNLPFYRAPLLEEVCGTTALTDWMAALRGGNVAYGPDALHAELGRLERLRDETTRRARELKRMLGARHA